MLTTFIRFAFIYYLCIYIYLKSSNTSIFSFKINIVVSCMASSLTCILESHFDGLHYFIPLLFLWILLSILNKKPQFNFVTIIISFCVSIITFALASFVILLILFPIYKFYFEQVFPYEIFAILTGILQVGTIYKFFQLKRFRKGIPVFSSSTFINITTVPCILLMGVILYIRLYRENFQHQLALLIIYIFTLAFLIFWWQAQITKSYRHRLLMRELESRRTSEAEKDTLIQKLYAEIDRLARISHRDNSLIMAIKDAAIKGLRTDFESTEELVATREKLIANIEKLSEGRSSIPSDYHEKNIREFKTGLGLLDDLLQLMDNNAIEQEITFSVHFGVSIEDFVPSDISESDLVHTVDDLLKNAFKSTRTCEKRIVQLQFYKLGKHLVIEVSDNGIPFEVRTLVNMGIEKRTTYEDGSGIGLMDIWSTKEKYRATYHLDEYATATPFSKKISLTFDKKNRYSIRTWRKDEILKMSRRADLQVYDDDK